jgi:hypothetical protein
MKIEDVLILGGVGFIAYYLLKKPKQIIDINPSLEKMIPNLEANISKVNSAVSNEVNSLLNQNSNKSDSTNCNCDKQTVYLDLSQKKKKKQGLFSDDIYGVYNASENATIAKRNVQVWEH